MQRFLTEAKYSPVMTSPAMSPMMPIMAKRPLLISCNWSLLYEGFSSSATISLMPSVSQGLSFGAGVTKVNMYSKHMRVKKTCIKPAAGSCCKAMMGSSETLVRAAASPMGCKPAAVWNQPPQASMATRPCFNSAARHCKIVSSELLFVKPAGSQQASLKGPPVPSKLLGKAQTDTCFSARAAVRRREPASTAAAPREAQARAGLKKPASACCELACAAGAETVRDAAARRAGGVAKASWAEACARAVAAPAASARFFTADGMLRSGLRVGGGRAWNQMAS
mmetsp:Transcript_39562/g.102358  ORF Transcript_39562/g.102358 Transcript_39562/m.102358 type:complete len:281 (+) Transcript_39562:236-1078(+)